MCTNADSIIADTVERCARAAENHPWPAKCTESMWGLESKMVAQFIRETCLPKKKIEEEEMHYSDWDQRHMDIKSGEEMDRQRERLVPCCRCPGKMSLRRSLEGYATCRHCCNGEGPP